MFHLVLLKLLRGICEATEPQVLLSGHEHNDLCSWWSSERLLAAAVGVVLAEMLIPFIDVQTATG